ncbi:hypothetical protein [Acrocarpospora catenulata]|uniref:hypothetical protein n=1 Tax=Acrocarpospora catenulata TaxID=2836182 RepID=UPI001BD9373E|nr:hypothetical protein [Acrocarpospora catenulata]
MDSVLCGLAANPALPPELVDRLITALDEECVGKLAECADLTRAQAVALASRHEFSVVRLVERGLLTADDVDPVTQPAAALGLLAEGAGRPAWARLFAAHPDTERRESLAACPDLPSDVLETLAADPNPSVVAELALWAAPELTARLAEHPHAGVRSAVALNESTPPTVLAALLTGEGLPPAQICRVCDPAEAPIPYDPWRSDSCDGSHESTVDEMRLRALGNRATPPAAVVGFADHPFKLFRHFLAIRPDLPSATYERLANSPEPGVRAALAENPAIDEALMRVLATDLDGDVLRNLACNPALPLDLLTHLAGTVRIGSTLLPRVASASPVEVEELAASPNPAVRMLLAERRDLPPEIRDTLAADPDAKVVKAIAPHPGLSVARLRAMVDRHGVRVIAQVAKNPDASPALLEDLTRHEPPARKAFPEIARRPDATVPALLACLSDRKARRVAAGHPALPPPVIAELLADDDWQVVAAAAANPSLPLAVMVELAPPM